MAGMKRADYLEMRREIQSEFDEKLAALDKVFAMFGGTPVSSNGSTPASDWTHEKTKRDAVRDAVKVLVVPHFSLKDVRSVLETNFSDYSAGITDNQLSAILSKLAENKEITLEKKKVGKSPAVYGHKA